MADLQNQYRILYVLYEALNNNKIVSISQIKTQDLYFMNAVGILGPELFYLEKNGFIERKGDYLELTGNGLKTTVLLFRKFVAFIKQRYSQTLSSWINIFDLNMRNDWPLVHDVYFHIEKQPLVKNAFLDYLENLQSIENLESFEVDKYKLDDLIDDIFPNIDDVNKLFEHKFNIIFFRPPLRSQTILRKAIRGREIRFTDLVSTIGSIIDSISSKEINGLLTAKQIKGSINKIKTLLDEKNVNYDPNTIETLKVLHHIRNTTYPVHETGPEIIIHLEKLNISYPIENERDAAIKILQSFNTCLLQMKNWLR